jgi:hypothetical protein
VKYLRKYESHKDIDAICREYSIRNYTINTDMSIDIYDDIILSCFNLKEFPLKFGNVINGCFDCDDNQLSSLVGCPKSVGGGFYCSYNELTSLIGCPKSVGGFFHCRDNNIDTFEGLDFINIGSQFFCLNNPIWEIWRLFQDHTKFEFFNDCDIIREDRVIILERLNFFLDYIGKRTVTKVGGYKCI